MTSHQDPSQAKSYNRTKLIIGVISSFFTITLMAVLVASGLSRVLGEYAQTLSPHRMISLALFVTIVGAGESLVSFPLGFYASYVIEHRYGLSNQSVGRWVWERLKGLLLGVPIGLLVILFLYYCLERFAEGWWLPVSIAMTLLTVLLARLAPVLIMPMFYKFAPVQNGELKDRIMRLCGSLDLHIEGIYTFNLSKNTKKANAGFTGIGKSRRIILGDTLVREFTIDEIETVFAHELGHYRYRHITVGIILGTISTFVGLFLASRLYAWSLAAFGFSAMTELGALPLMAIWFSLFALITSPISNAISRRHERRADSYAVAATGNAGAFVSALRKLAAQNMADPEPHPVIEFLFFSHPSIGRRIRAVGAMGGG